MGKFPIAKGKFPMTTSGGEIATGKFAHAKGKFPDARGKSDDATWGTAVAMGKFAIAPAKPDSYWAMTQDRWVMMPPTMTPAMRRGR